MLPWWRNSSNDPKNSASSWNARAVALMCEGSFLDALQVLHEALYRLKQSSLTPSATWNLPPEVFNYHPRRTVKTVGLHVDIPEDSGSVDSALRMYQRAFLTSVVDDEELLSNPRAARTVEAVLHFNRGLCYHALAFTLRQGCGACLGAARTAYGEALLLLDRGLAVPSDGRLLRLAVCNNVGHVCANLGEFRETELLLLMLRLFLVRFQEQEGGHGPVEDSLFEFYYNAIAVKGTYRCAPAA